MGLIDGLIERARRRRALVLVGVLSLVGLGVWSVLRIPIDAFPDVTNIQVDSFESVSARSTRPRWLPPLT